MESRAGRMIAKFYSETTYVNALIGRAGASSGANSKCVSANELREWLGRQEGISQQIPWRDVPAGQRAGTW